MDIFLTFSHCILYMIKWSSKKYSLPKIKSVLHNFLKSNICLQFLLQVMSISCFRECCVFSKCEVFTVSDAISFAHICASDLLAAIHLGALFGARPRDQDWLRKNISRSHMQHQCWEFCGVCLVCGCARNSPLCGFELRSRHLPFIR